MSIDSDEVGVDESWKVDLEIALLEDADFFRIRSICANRPVPANSRSEVWRICLKPELQTQTMINFDEVFDLPNQCQLHMDCEQAATDLVNELILSTQPPEPEVSEPDDDDQFDLGLDAELHPVQLPSVTQLTSDFESVLTHFAQTYSLPYEPTEGWVSIVRVLYQTMKPLDRQDLYACFASVYHRFIPTGVDVNARLSNVFRILLQYHEPQLCSLLDSLKISPDMYANPWLLSLFNCAHLAHDVLVSLWDIYFLVADPFLGLFIILVLLINVKPNLFGESKGDESDQRENDERTEQSTFDINMESVDDGSSNSIKRPGNFDRSQVLNMLVDLPKPMQIEDLESLIELTQLFARRTPNSFRSQYFPLLFGNTPSDTGSHLLATTLCMPVSVQEVLEAQSSALRETADRTVADCVDEDSKSTIRYLLVDCRPAEQYNAGHLSTAFFLDSELMYSEPSQFQLAVKALLQSQRRAISAGSYAAGEHITLLSSGQSPEGERVANMIVSTFLRLNTPYVSLIEGGYIALHEALGPERIGHRLANHEPRSCLCCRDQGIQSKKNDRIFVYSSTLKADADLTKANQHANSIESLLSKFSGTLFKGNLTGPKAKASLRKRISPSGQTQFATPKSFSSEDKTSSDRSQKLRPDAQSVSERTRPVSYRNTSSVFSIDDDDEVSNDDFAQEEFNQEACRNVSSSDRQKISPSDTRSKYSWLRRWPLGHSVTESNTLSGGDFPTRPGGLDSSEPGDLIDATQWSCRPEVRGVFGCQLIGHAGRFSDTGFLVLVERHLLLLRDHVHRSPVRLVASIGSAIQSVLSRSSTDKGSKPSTKHAVVLRSVPLDLITRITSNKRLPECITFHYSSADPSDLLRLNEPVMGTRDRLYIPQAGDAVRMIKMAICHTSLAAESS
ncbi:TBC1 domain family member 23 [Paragonimus westermani]|uniref:TBC1 domain family member 23 n=1 Tax=Paragonimus westermani TaxID=34504 RepID=A0A5J4NYB7_9TREM|nr:TBC1 domain family member 23 [Paragonimus westermani]